MKKLAFALIFLSLLTYGAIARAAADSSGGAFGQVTIEDLGVENPGILPTNPFYFLKQWNRSFQRAITRDPLKKVSYELDITNQQAAEIKQLLNFSQDASAIREAVDHYRVNVDQLRDRLQDLTETSENPGVDRFLEQLTDLSLKHQGLLNEIAAKFEDDEDLQSSLYDAGNRVGEVLMEIPERFESPAKFEKRIERVVVDQDGYARMENALQVLGGIEDRLPESAKEAIFEVRQRLQEKIQQSAEEDMRQVMPLMKELETGDRISLPPVKIDSGDDKESVLRPLPIGDEKLESGEDEPVFKLLNEAR